MKDGAGVGLIWETDVVGVVGGKWRLRLIIKINFYLDVERIYNRPGPYSWHPSLSVFTTVCLSGQTVGHLCGRPNKVICRFGFGPKKVLEDEFVGKMKIFRLSLSNKIDKLYGLPPLLIPPPPPSPVLLTFKELNDTETMNYREM